MDLTTILSDNRLPGAMLTAALSMLMAFGDWYPVGLPTTSPLTPAEPDKMERSTLLTVTGVWVILGATVSMPILTILPRLAPTTTTAIRRMTTTAISPTRMTL